MYIVHIFIHLCIHIRICANTHMKVIEDCCQLVKANSIRGNKLDNVSVVFTPASNLKKTNGMEVGQVRMYTYACLRVTICIHGVYVRQHDLCTNLMVKIRIFLCLGKQTCMHKFCTIYVHNQDVHNSVFPYRNACR